jgi:hypothetical protein
LRVGKLRRWRFLRTARRERDLRKLRENLPPAVELAVEFAREAFAGA